MAHPSFLVFVAEKKGKPVEQWDAADWQDAAIRAATLLDAAYPLPIKSKKRGRPRLYRKSSDTLTLAWFRLAEKPAKKGKQGRPTQHYHGWSVERIAELIQGVQSDPAVRKKWGPQKTRTLVALWNTHRLEEGNRPLPSGIGAIERALRRLKKADTNNI